MCDVVLSPDEQLVAFVEYYGEAIFVYELNTGKLLHNIKKPVFIFKNKFIAILFT